jgi:bifunctional DNA-binding transcriptional regulator/antitoxin component of YhaV-PrlF toxin-antitoxin module
MMTQTCKIDSQNRITLPPEALNLFGYLPNMEVIMELTKTSIVLKPLSSAPITADIASLELPVGEWKQIAQEIEEGRVK